MWRGMRLIGSSWTSRMETCWLSPLQVSVTSVLALVDGDLDRSVRAQSRPVDHAGNQSFPPQPFDLLADHGARFGHQNQLVHADAS
jgi:hypothetical protein